MVYKYSAHCFSLDFISECLQRRKKLISLSVSVLDSKTKEDDKIVLQSVGYEISRERQGLLLQSRKMAQRWNSFWKTSFLARGASFLGGEAAKWATNSRQVTHHKKIEQWSFLKVLRAASRKTTGSGLLSIFPVKCRTFNVSSKSGHMDQNANCPLQF